MTKQPANTQQTDGSAIQDALVALASAIQTIDDVVTDAEQSNE